MPWANSVGRPAPTLLIYHIPCITSKDFRADQPLIISTPCFLFTASAYSLILISSGLFQRQLSGSSPNLSPQSQKSGRHKQKEKSGVRQPDLRFRSRDIMTSKSPSPAPPVCPAGSPRVCNSRELSPVLDGDVLGVDKLAHALERLLAALEDLHLLLRVLMHEWPAPQPSPHAPVRPTACLNQGRAGWAHLLDHFPQEAEPPWRVDDEDDLGTLWVVLPSTRQK